LHEVLLPLIMVSSNVCNLAMSLPMRSL